FTLAELLIALAILGVIAVFTIPKILIASQNNQYVASAKEAAATIANSFDMYKMQNTVNTTTNSNVLTPFMNYVRIQTTGSIDGRPGVASSNCGNFSPCLLMHNGGMLRTSNVSYSTLSDSHAIEALFDPDGRLLGTAASKFLNGRVSSRAHVAPGTTNSSGNTYDPDPSLDPVWFTWN
ncbi:MAG: type II secretion system protein, partial [Vampirovibrionales bacterium]|nr:type II secretion system protein [Vampirovibrionales bacterium]